MFLLFFIGAYVIGTCSTDAKAAKAKAVGADEVILYSQKDFVEETMRITDGKGVNVIYDSVGKDTFSKGITTTMIYKGAKSLSSSFLFILFHLISFHFIYSYLTNLTFASAENILLFALFQELILSHFLVPNSRIWVSCSQRHDG